jgi:hypothetical protein
MTINYEAYTLPSEAIRGRLGVIPLRKKVAAAPSTRPCEVAKRFLRLRLVGEPIRTVDVVAAAAGEGIGQRTLYRAKTKLGIAARKDGPVALGGGTLQPNRGWK